jgi:hypothetical protein
MVGRPTILMRKTSVRFPSQCGTLVVQQAQDSDGQLVILHGDSQGLRSFGELLMALAELDQTKSPPNDPNWAGVGMSVHLRPGLHIHPQSLQVVVMRLDGRKTARLPDWFRKARMKPRRPVVETWIENTDSAAPPKPEPYDRDEL